MNVPASQPHDEGDGTVFGQARMYDGNHGHDHPAPASPAPQAPSPRQYAPPPLPPAPLPPAPYAPPPQATHFTPPAGHSPYPPSLRPAPPQAQVRRPPAPPPAAAHLRPPAPVPPYPAPVAQSSEPPPQAPPRADGDTPVAIPVIHGLDQPQRIEIELSGDLRISGELKGFSLKPMDPPSPGPGQA